MKRTLYADLLTWKSHPTHSPLLIRGARQVGKSHLVQTFGTNEFREILTINFEKEPRFESSFESFNPTDIINRLYLQTGKRVEPGKDLLFLDEIQECPNALAALRYFKEDLPELHVIATGSLLEFVLNDENLRMPVGRVDSLFLKPLSFSEFLSAIGSEQLNDYLETVTPDKGIEPFIHEELSQCLREYFFIGGMPAIIQEYLLTKNLQQVQLKQTSLMATLRQDFSKYATKANHRYMQKILEVSPG